MDVSNNSNFLSKIRNIFWPINGIENKKFIPMALMMTFILVNYSTLRSIKDGLVVVNIGPEALGFLKLYFVLPSALILMVLYAKLCNIMSPQKVFKVVTTTFIIAIAIFTFLIYPNPNVFHPSPEKIDLLIVQYPIFKWILKIAGKWSYASIYIIAEMWGSMMLSLLFWQFANQVTSTLEAKRFYSMFGLISNAGVLVFSLWVLPVLLDDKLDLVAEEVKLIPILSIVILNGLIVLFLYQWINSNILTDIRLYNPDAIGAKKKKSKVKLSLSDSFKMILTSSYLGLIAILVFSYGVSIVLVEGIWKSKIRELYPTVGEYTSFMVQFLSYQSIVAILFMLVGSNILRRVSWFTAAMLTPMMILVTGIAFFSFIFFDNTVGLHIAALFSGTPLMLAVMIGAAQNVLSKGAKYSLFDSTKEMSYIPLDDELKTKGKAAVDVIGGRLGKSGGGFIQSTFFLIMPAASFAEATPYFAAIFFIIVIIWLISVKVLGAEYYKKLAESEEIIPQDKI
ncbi:MAG: NTP/NDP exchange transporter [Rickettsiaceae bacterium]|nr:NTP/NDP exchange transporter [Rickettsiaceae bacterium]